MAGTPTLLPTLLHRDAPAAPGQLTEAFGSTVAARYAAEDGTVLHAELAHGDGVVRVGSKDRGGPFDEAVGDAGPSGGRAVVDDDGDDDPGAHRERPGGAGS
ncbi:hypothetical protein ABT168_16870 [Streptomyces sp. NPDC001793]|uniref:hypothetical protein n=1 Tax=Streptomyces sp. NPDC001793 TaxID=3154657 RepID=UPI0033247450